MVLKIFMDAWEHGDVAALIERLCEDARWAMPPAALWFEGRAAIENLLRLYPPGWQGRHFRLLPLGANRQPAAVAYLRAAGDVHHRLSALHVLRIERGQIAEITTFSGKLAGFELAPVL